MSIPLQGFGVVATQTQANHDPLLIPAAEIQFFDAAGMQFRGFEFEGDFMAGGLIFEMFTSDTSLGGPTVTNSTAQIINGDGGFNIDIRSVILDVRTEDPVSPSGGVQKPGVFLSDAIPVIAEAGNNLAYSASTLTATASGPGNLNLVFALGIDDADLALNASIAAFEELMKELFVNGFDASTFFLPIC